MPGAVAELLAKDFEGPVAVKESVVDLDPNTRTRVFGNDPERLAYLIVNIGGGEVFVGFSPEVMLDSRIILGPGGATLSVDVREDFTLPTHELFGVSFTIPGTLYTVAVVRDSGRKVEA